MKERVYVCGGGGQSYKFCQKLNLDLHAEAAREAMALRAEFKILSRHLGALGRGSCMEVK